MNKMILSIVAAAVVAGGVGFYGGTQYAASQAAASASARAAQNGGGAGFGRRGGAQGGAGGFTAGEILSKDDKSITIKLRDGSTKIVFFSGSTSIGKMTAGAATDLAVGSQVTVQGSANSDGSLTAQSIQLRPSLPISGQPNPAPAAQ